MKPKELPTGYHVENFLTLLTTVYQQYNDLLSESEINLYQRISNCSYGAQSLYVRLLTRKGPVFRIDKLHYDDITSTPIAIDELINKELVRLNTPQSAHQLFTLFTKAELLQLFNQHADTRSTAKLRKPELITLLLQNLPDQSVNNRIQSAHPYLEPNGLTEFETFRTCFFGNGRQDLNEFVITDLGHLKYETYRLDKQVRYFTQREQIEHQIAYSQMSQQLEDKANSVDAETLFSYASQLPPPKQYGAPHPALSRRYQKLLITIARQLERMQQTELALELYQQCELHPSRERRARILKKRAAYEVSWDLCMLMLESTHPEEREFALRFTPGLAKILDRQLTNATPPPLDQNRLLIKQSEVNVEISVAMALSDDHHSCYYVENTLFCSLFGLLFWDIIFTPINGAFINPFQRGPLDLFSEHFYHTRKTQLDQRLRQLDDGEWQTTVLKHFTEKQDIANHFVYWGSFDKGLLEHCFRCLPITDLRCIFQRMLEHPGLFSSGFPDLIRFVDKNYAEATTDRPLYQLIEVKAPGDRLQANQKRWFDFFSQHRIPAQVVWVDWDENG